MRSSGCVSCTIFTCKTHSTPSTLSTLSQQCAEIFQHREKIIESFLHDEQKYINELEEFLVKTIQPLNATFSKLNQNFLDLNIQHLEELIKFHYNLSHILRDSLKTQHCLGRIFIQFGSTLKPIFQAYCAQHAKIIFVLNHNKDRIFHSSLKTDSTNGENRICEELCQKLSLPSDRLEKYTNLLREYLYTLEEFHIDRRDTQQAVEYYTELILLGSDWRKRKEWELDIVHSTIHGIGIETLKSLGDALYLSSVNILSENNINQTSSKCIALLYSSTIFLLSTLSNKNEYQFENRWPINQIRISKVFLLNQYGFKVNAPLDQSYIISFSNSIEYDEWCEKLSSLSNFEFQHQGSIIKLSSLTDESNSLSLKLMNPSLKYQSQHRFGITYCLRPHSPMRTVHPNPILANQSISSINSNTNEFTTIKRFMNVKKSKANEFLKRVETSENDALLLSVIEAYYVPTISTVPKSKQFNRETFNKSSTTYNNNNEYKILYEILNELCSAYKVLKDELKEEKLARKQLECQIEKCMNLSSDK